MCKLLVILNVILRGPPAMARTTIVLIFQDSR